MYSKKMLVPIRFNLSCFELIVKWDGELEYVFTDDAGLHYFTSDEFTEICRAFDSVEFTNLVEAHNACVDSYEKYGDSYAKLFTAYGCNASEFSSAVDDFEESIEQRIACMSRRENAHEEWNLACSTALHNADITFYTLCEIGSRMLSIDYFMLAN